ncbi:STE3-domain-containing protein [Peniophora sp. CONT]|nr:STE3-domain-containing protein [Peniophora sp. CONT]
MGAVDPTFPLYPIACSLATAMLLLVLLTSFARRSWNLGVTFLTFWLMVENLAGAINSIAWADNADVKFVVYCDIVSHLGLICYVVKPMSTLIITRRLYLIANLRSVDVVNSAARRKNLAIEWIAGLIFPIAVAGPIYYVVQLQRFNVIEGFGCANSIDGSILAVLLVQVWSVIPPLISVTVYYPKVVLTFYRHNRTINHFSNDSVSRINYFRILALASIDILLTLPMGIVFLVLFILPSASDGPLPFYKGWREVHSDWTPISVSYDELESGGTFAVAQGYFVYWTSPVLAFTIFGLLGLTSEARASYWRIFCTAAGWVGWKPAERRQDNRVESLGPIEFGERSAGKKSLDTDSTKPYPVLVLSDPCFDIENSAGTVHEEPDKAGTL